MEYRQKFGKDVFVDIIAFRRRGHNELDEPAFTQPTMYKKIAETPTVATIYTKQLLDEAVLSDEQAAQVSRTIEAEFEEDLKQTNQVVPIVCHLILLSCSIRCQSTHAQQD